MPKFNPPEELNFQKPAWQDWKERFTRFRLATKLNKEEGIVQVSTLIYAMGKEADKIFKSLHFDNDEDKDNYDIVLSKFEEYFIPKINVIFERAKFYKRSQEEGESIEEFVRSLHELTETCDFIDKNTQIRDRLVIGLRDKRLCEKLQLREDLTLEKAVEISRNHELIKQQNSEESLNKEVEAMSLKKRAHGTAMAMSHNKGWSQNKEWKTNNRNFHRPPTQERMRGATRCSRCEGVHAPRSCPAFGKTCSKCKKRNHFARACKARNIHCIDTESEEADGFVGTVGLATRRCARETQRASVMTVADEQNDDAWHVNLWINKRPVNFKIDTGADVTVMPRHVYEKLNIRNALKQTKTILHSPAGKLQTDGFFIQSVTHKDKTIKLRIFVINTESPHCLLSRNASESLKLVARINELKIPSAIFGNTGVMKTDPVKIEIKCDATPHSTSVPRRIPIPLLDKVKKELERMKNMGIIEEITEPTEWCAPIVVVPKAKSEQIRLCVDLTKLNKAVKREKFILPTMDDIAHKLSGAQYFSRLDCASGFWQIPLQEDSAKLTTFITPFGRYFFKVLPFGITSASEIFQRKMQHLLKDCTGSDCFIDDVIVYGKSEEEHDIRLKETLKVIEKSGLKLNKDKCEFKKDGIKFLGFKINREGMVPDDDKIKAIQELDDPKNVTELKSILGIINFIGRHVPNLSTTLKPLYDLLKKESTWFWGPQQKEALTEIKSIITNAPILAFYDPKKPTTVTADSSSYGIGGALLQQHGDQMKPVAYCSRTLTAAEKGYAQIEKETLAAVWACEKFSRFLVGLKSFTLETDHKPIVPLINTKDLDQTPLRCQRLLMRLMRFNPIAVYKPGKDLHLADTLSRKPLQIEDKTLEIDVSAYVNNIEQQQWNADLDSIREQTREDSDLSQLRALIENGWPKHKQNVPTNLKRYYDERTSMSVINGLIVKDLRIVIPHSMRSNILKEIHEGHQGINKCRERARQSVWWPSINQDIATMVEKCRHCEERRPTNRKEPLLTTPLPERAWQKAAADLFFCNNKTFIVLVDYYSRYIEIGYLPNQRSVTTILKLKSFFARHGIPETLVTDNGTQFTSREFKQFSKEWRFTHQTTSPHFAQANGQAERAVQIAKKILTQKDPMSALLAYRSTPHTSTKFSPSTLSMGRQLRTTLPTLPNNLTQQIITRKQIQNNDAFSKTQHKRYFDRRHGATHLPSLHPKEQVLIKMDNEKGWTTPARIISKAQSPRSYIVDTGTTQLRRNRRHIIHTHHNRPLRAETYFDNDDFTSEGDMGIDTSSDTTTETPSNQAVTPSQSPPSGYVTRFGRRIQRPARYLD